MTENGKRESPMTTNGNVRFKWEGVENVNGECKTRFPNDEKQKCEVRMTGNERWETDDACHEQRKTDKASHEL